MFNCHDGILIRTPVQSLRNIFNVDFEKSVTVFQEGIYLASPELWGTFQKMYQLSVEEKIKLRQTLLKYFLRSCTRCTPYATFAGTAIAQIANRTQLVLDENRSHKKAIRIDTNYLVMVVNALVSLPEIKEQLQFHLNNSLYKDHNGLRFVRHVSENRVQSYHLNSIDTTAHLTSIIKISKNGIKLSALLESIELDKEISKDEAKEFIDELLSSQLLLSELEPSVTGIEPFNNLIDRLEQLKGVGHILPQLRKIQNLIQNPDAGVEYYQGIENELKKISISKEVPKNTLQLDLFLSSKTLHVQIDIVNAIIEQSTALMVFATRNSNPDLDKFIRKYIEKYDSDEMKLTTVLDVDTGLGYAGANNEATARSGIIDDLFISNFDETEKISQNYMQQYTLKKHNDYLEQKFQQITITDYELSTYKKQAEMYTFPNSMYIMGSLLKKDNALEKEKFTFDLNVFSGPSGANLLGRFTHGDKKIEKFAEEIIEAEEQAYPDVIFAEIVHLPEARIGNILLRPVLRKYEIPYIGISGAPKEYQIPINDIMVRVQNGEVLLRSKKHNKRIIPRLTTAHNYSNNSLPIYKFLCDLQHQGYYRPVLWDWGVLSSLKHLPRVVYKNLIIKKARWRIEEKDVKDLPKDEEGYLAYFRHFREVHELPQRIVYVEGDNELLIDFDEKDHIGLFLHYLKKYKNIILEEFLFTEENCVVTDVNGAPYTNEMVIPVKWEGKTTPLQTPKVKNSGGVKRKFTPGSEWLYFKIYCGAKSAEQVLKDKLLPFVEQGVYTKLFEKFFFIRYKDEFPHFRLRFYNQDIGKQPHLQKEITDILQPLVDGGIIDKIILDTYKRELERYDPDLIEETESLYFYDSLCILRFLNLPAVEDQDRQRLLFAVRGVDVLLNDFGLGLTAKKDLLKTMQANYFKEFGSSPTLQKQLNEKYRKYQKDIFSFLIPKNDIKNKFYDAASLLKNRSKQNGPIVTSILKKMEDGRDIKQLPELLPSYIHMFINRLYIAQQRKYELVIYHFLEKYYTSAIAIENAKQ